MQSRIRQNESSEGVYGPGVEREDKAFISLHYQPPFDWECMLSYFRTHQIPELETVTAEYYERVFDIDGQTGYFRVSHASTGNTLRLEVVGASEGSISRITQRVRRMFDLDMDPALVAKVMERDFHLDELWQRYPGLRVAQTWDRFETLIATILGQVVSVKFGRTLVRELMDSYGKDMEHPVTGKRVHLFPTPEMLIDAELSEVRTSDLRRRAIREMAALAMDSRFLLQERPERVSVLKSLLAVPGVGEWSAEYIAMRAFGDLDAFPATDYGLKQEIKLRPGMDVNLVRPWRAYAATALWRHYGDKKGKTPEHVL